MWALNSGSRNSLNISINTGNRLACRMIMICLREITTESVIAATERARETTLTKLVVFTPLLWCVRINSAFCRSMHVDMIGPTRSVNRLDGMVAEVIAGRTGMMLDRLAADQGDRSGGRLEGNTAEPR